MSTYEITEELIDQFGRTWRELRDAVTKTPADEWRKGDTDYLIPARLAYHIVYSADSYATHRGYKEHRPYRRFKLNWEAATPDELPSREQLFTYINETEVAVKEWLLGLGDEGLLEEQVDYEWTGERRLGRALYLLRHNQWHIGELNALLCTRGLEPVEW